MGIRVGDDREIKTITVPLMLTDTGTTLTYLPRKNYDEELKHLEKVNSEEEKRAKDNFFKNLLQKKIIFRLTDVCQVVFKATQ